jgi:hypothetical protein
VVAGMVDGRPVVVVGMEEGDALGEVVGMVETERCSVGVTKGGAMEL